MAEVIYVNHTADHIPGDGAVVDDNEAQRLITAGMAREATADDAEAIVRATVDAEAAADADAQAEADKSAQLDADAERALADAKETKAATKK